MRRRGMSARSLRMGDVQAGRNDAGDLVRILRLLPGDLAALGAADRKQTCTSVHATGTIDPTNGNNQIATDVDIVVATPGATVTAPPTSTISADLPVSGPGAPAVVWLALALCAAFVVTTRRFRSGQR